MVQGISGDEKDIAQFLWTHLENAKIIEIPLSLVYFILVGYVLLGSIFVSNTESWGYMESVYFR